MMLRIAPPQKSVQGAKEYFKEVLTKGDYYIKEHAQEMLGPWGGKAAEMLGLDGDVGATEFNSLCEHVNPSTGEKLTARTKDNRRVFTDMTFSVPKSVSVIYEHSGDEQILDAFRQSVRETMQEMEGEVQARVRKGTDWNSTNNRTTGNMVWGEFIHFTSRPVDGVPDPHLHAHMTVFNATHDGVEQKWKAIELGDVKRNAPYYQAAFFARMSKRLSDLGYGISRTDKAFEITGVPQSVIEKASRRTAEIEAFAEQRNITYADDKAKIGPAIREAKMESLSLDDVRGYSKARRTDEENAALDAVKTVADNKVVTATDAMDYALAHTFERASVVTDKQLLTEALKYGVGTATVDDVRAQLDREDIITRLVDMNGESQLQTTTLTVLKEEREMIAFARNGRGTRAPLKVEEHDFQPIVSDDGDSFELNAEQQAAVCHVLSSNDNVIAIRGGAGVGKTTLMSEAISGIEEGDKTVFVFAPSNAAAHDVLRDKEGFSNAETVQQLLVNEDLQHQLADQVIWIDEAGLLSSKQMKQLFDIADTQNARVILSGDVRQHASVERGDALRILEQHAGIQAAEVQEITRQRGAYKNAVSAISEGNVEAGFSQLDSLGFVQEIKSEDRHVQLARDYVEATSEKRGKKHKTALVVSPTHSEGGQVTELIRNELKNLADYDPRKVGEDERHFTQLRNLNLTEAQRGDARNYEAGQVIQAFGKIDGLKSGDKATVTGWDERGNVLIENQHGESQTLDVSKANKFNVYQSRDIALSTGDKIRITQNGRTQDNHRLTNSAMYQVKGFTPKGDIRLNNGWVVSQDHGHLTHGYVTTSHTSQGKTVDKVFIAQGASSLRASSLEQFYVSVSRGKEQVTIYTDDKATLLEAVKESGQRKAASELVSEEEAAQLLKQSPKEQLKQESQREQAKNQLPKERSTRYGEMLARMAGLAKIYAGRVGDSLRKKYGIVPTVQRMKPERGPRLAR